MALSGVLTGSSCGLRALASPPPLRALATARRLLWGGLERASGTCGRHGSCRQAVAASSQQHRPAAAAAVGAAAAPTAPEREQQGQQQPAAPHGHALQHALHEHPHAGIELVVGPMFAGKSTELLRRVAAYEAQGLSVAVVKSARDDRYCSASVVTHSGLKRPCFAAPTLAAFRQQAGESYADFHVIAVDEAQFFPDLLEFCAAAADGEAKRLVVAGLDGDFQRRRFGQVLDLQPLADSVTKLLADCKFCAQAGRRVPAPFSLRATADTRQEVVGGADTYAPVCRRHYVALSRPAVAAAAEAAAAAAAEAGDAA